MKKLTYVFMLFVFIISSCTYSITDIKPEQMNYVKRAIICDAKSPKFTILNSEELAEFFDGEEIGIIVVKYMYIKTKNVKFERKIEIYRSFVGGKIQYTIDYRRKTFPFSDCRKLKTEQKYF